MSIFLNFAEEEYASDCDRCLFGCGFHTRDLRHFALDERDLTKHNVNYLSPYSARFSMPRLHACHAKGRVAEADVGSSSIAETFCNLTNYFGQMGFLNSCSFASFQTAVAKAGTIVSSVSDTNRPPHHNCYHANSNCANNRRHHHHGAGRRRFHHQGGGGHAYANNLKRRAAHAHTQNHNLNQQQHPPPVTVSSSLGNKQPSLPEKQLISENMSSQT